jgi:hypothetical protein
MNRARSCHWASVRSVAYGRRGGLMGGFLSGRDQTAAEHTGLSDTL